MLIGKGVEIMKENKKWYQKISNWVIIVACIILVPILVMNLWIMFQAKTNPKKIPDVFGYKPFIVLSGSMETEIHKGDLIIAKKINPKKLKENDVIAFRDAENTVTTHRIIDIVEDDGQTYFITKGDNNNTQDQNMVEYKDVEGIYVLRIPNVGNMMNSLAQPTTILIVVMGITIIFIIGFMISNKKQQEADRKEYLEYKKMKEEEEKKKQEESKKQKENSSKKKTTTKKNTKKSK